MQIIVLLALNNRYNIYSDNSMYIGTIIIKIATCSLYCLIYIIFFKFLQVLDQLLSCDNCSQLVHLWDEFSQQARVNIFVSHPNAQHQCNVQASILMLALLVTHDKLCRILYSANAALFCVIYINLQNSQLGVVFQLD
jgi:hypothetical protein